jgi:hypothetical protein
MNQPEALVEIEETEKTDTGTLVPAGSEDSEREPRNLRTRLRKAFYAFSEWCDRLDIDEGGLRP